MTSRVALVVPMCLVVAWLGGIACRQEPAGPTSTPSSPARVGGDVPSTPIGAAAHTQPPDAVTAASQPITATLEPRSGSSMNGTVTLTPQVDGILVSLDLRGAKPGKHGIHFHQNADCSAQDAASAGDHWNPDQHPHGLPPTPARHLGDLGNIEVGQDGSGRLNLAIQGATLTSGDPHSLTGRALIVHAQQDDGSQPTGASGAREACAEIKGQ